MSKLDQAFGGVVSIVPNNKLPYTYGVRHADNDWSTPVTIEHHVVVNRYCLLYTATALKFPPDQDWAILSPEQKTALKKAVKRQRNRDAL